MKIILLAGGKGTRMNLDVPKVLAPFAGKTLLEASLDHLLASGLDPHPLVVVGYQAERVRQVASHYPVTFVEQTEQLGTGHAVKVCRDFVDPSDDVMVLYGDHPLLRPQTLQMLGNAHRQSDAVISLVTYTLKRLGDFDGAFAGFGRLVRDAAGQVQGIREMRDASDAEKALLEINPAYYAFSGPWLWQNLDRLQTHNAQKEYYLTDLVGLAIADGLRVNAVGGTDLREAVGVNTKEQLAMAEQLSQEIFSS